MSETTTPPTTPPALPRSSRTVEQVIDDLPRLGLTRLGWVGLALGFFLGMYEASVLALVLPSLEHSLGVDTAALSIPVAISAVGFAVGAYVVGLIADRRGRLLGMRITFSVVAVGALMGGFAWDVPSLTVARLIMGCGMGAVVALVTAYVGELSPRSQRGRQVALFTLVSTVLIVITSLLALPLLSAVPDAAWRYLLGLPVIAILIVLLIGKRHIVESPRWLVEHGRLDDAVVIVRQLDRRARRGSSDLDGVSIVEPTRVPRGTVVKPMVILFSTRRLVVRLAIISIASLVFYTAFFGLTTYLAQFLISTGIAEDRALDIVATSRISGLVAAIVIVFIIERIERRLLIVGCIAAMAVGVALIMAGLGEGAAMAGTIIATLGTGVMVPALYTFVAEIFPTDVRATGTAFTDGISRLGGVIAPFAFVPVLLGAGPVAAGIFLIALMAVALVLILFGLRINTKGRTLDEASA